MDTIMMNKSVMRGMVFEKKNSPLRLVERQMPEPAANDLLIAVEACGVCRTDLHITEEELPSRKSPLILGHEIVGRIVAMGKSVTRYSIGNRVGVPWVGSTCQKCKYCLSNRENLCESPQFTGYSKDGGYATHTLADFRYCVPLPVEKRAEEIAPLLCAGLIGWRTLKLAGPAKNIGIYGFGAAAHIIAQVAIYQGRNVFAFTRMGDAAAQDYAQSLGACWSGDSSQMPPQKLDAALIFAPAGELVPLALKASDRGASIVCGGIHMSDIPSFPYKLLWEERSIRSVANLTREDAQEFFEIVRTIPVHTNVHVYPLERANQALSDLKSGKFNGAAVLQVHPND